jgi:hypothetical protein
VPRKLSGQLLNGRHTEEDWTTFFLLETLIGSLLSASNFLKLKFVQICLRHTVYIVFLVEKGPAALKLIVHPYDEDEEKDDQFFYFPSNGAPAE